MTVQTKLNSYAITDIVEHELVGDERFIFLIEASPGRSVTDVRTGEVESQTVVIDGVWDVTGDDSVPALLRKIKAVTRLASDEANGRKPVASFTEQAAQYMDASGVVMTPAEIADFRGEKWSEEQSFVVEFAGGARGLWPHEFPGQELAALGGLMIVPGAEAAERDQVVRFIDEDSGEPIASWSTADETERLEVLEERAAAEEAAADRAAVEELEAGRTPQIDGSPVSAMKAGDVVAYVKACRDQSWLGQLLHSERGSKKPRKSVMNAVMAALTEMGVEVED